MERKDALHQQATLIYDGECPICSDTAKWIKNKEDKGAFKMISCQSKILESEFPDITHSDCMRALHIVLRDGTVLVGEQALPEIFKRLKHYRYVDVALRNPVIKMFVRFFYRSFAKFRYRIADLYYAIFKKNID